ncbi:hypothetical protein [Halalkalibacillus halophilus]|uniref:hypothetical protein n=1 Tax=Halalkalibacillus halophilus TaxID=392827 RepID=UPI0004184D82|nr:hypothetical protein [Halalkalibacillus halophilus]
MKKNWIGPLLIVGVVVCFMVVTSISTDGPEAESELGDYLEAIELLDPEMSPEEVIHLLGEPQQDENFYSTAYIYYFGTDEETDLSDPYLGAVYVALEEGKLDAALVINWNGKEISQLNGYHYDPEEEAIIVHNSHSLDPNNRNGNVDWPTERVEHEPLDSHTLFNELLNREIVHGAIYLIETIEQESFIVAEKYNGEFFLQEVDDHILGYVLGEERIDISLKENNSQQTQVEFLEQKDITLHLDQGENEEEEMNDFIDTDYTFAVQDSNGEDVIQQIEQINMMLDNRY